MHERIGTDTQSCTAMAKNQQDARARHAAEAVSRNSPHKNLCEEKGGKPGETRCATTTGGHSSGVATCAGQRIAQTPASMHALHRLDWRNVEAECPQPISSLGDAGSSATAGLGMHATTSAGSSRAAECAEIHPSGSIHMEQDGPSMARIRSTGSMGSVQSRGSASMHSMHAQYPAGDGTFGRFASFPSSLFSCFVLEDEGSESSCTSGSPLSMQDHQRIPLSAVNEVLGKGSRGWRHPVPKPPSHSSDLDLREPLLPHSNWKQGSDCTVSMPHAVSGKSGGSVNTHEHQGNVNGNTAPVPTSPEDAAVQSVDDADGSGREDTATGMAYYAASSLFYSIMALFSKLLEDKGYPVWELTLFRALVILVVSLSTIRSAGGSPWGVRRGLLIVRGTLGYTSLALFFTACYYLPLATATTFTFLAPLIAALASPWLLRERVSPAVWAVIPVCSVAVVLIVRPTAIFQGGGGGVAALSTVGIAAGLAQPFFAASVKMVIRELRKTETTHVIILYLVLCTLVYSCIGCLLSWQHLVRPLWQDGLLLLGLGLCGYGNQLCTTKGLERAKAASVMSMQYSSLVFTQIAGVLVFGEVPTAVQAAGMAVIVLSMLGYLWYEARAAKSKA